MYQYLQEYDEMVVVLIHVVVRAFRVIENKVYWNGIVAEKKKNIST